MINLEKKIVVSIDTIRKHERLALMLDPKNGFHVAFSGGKDSVALLSLMKESKVKFVAEYNVTTIDPPESVRFIRDKFPEVRFVLPKTTFWELIERNGLPTRLTRYCCRRLKEEVGKSRVTVTGVRRQESQRRNQYNELALYKTHDRKFIPRDIDTMLQLNFECVNGYDRFKLSPILDWTEDDVWKYTWTEKLPINPMYDEVERVGCMFCPFAPKRQLVFYRERYPKYYKNILIRCQRYLDTHETHFNDAITYYKWWESKLSIDDFFAMELGK